MNTESFKEEELASPKKCFGLGELSPAEGARKKKRRLGMGEGSGRGKTAGRGNKGHRSRSGYRLNPGFEGGQMPLHRRIPKSGFTSRKKVKGENCYSLVSIEKINSLDTTNKVLSPEELYLQGVIRRKNARVKILGGGELTSKIIVQVHAVSSSARKAIEKVGGEVRLISC